MGSLDLTVEQLLLIAKGKPASEIHLHLMLVDKYDEWVHWIYRAIDHIVRQLEENPELREDRLEDELTIDIVSHLRMFQIDADHETKIGGHVDIRIRGPNSFLWLGEAKKHSTYDWLMKGFRQLDTRYSTGNPDQDAGGLLIYIFGPRVDEVMKKWKEHLGSQLGASITFAGCPLNPLAFISSHQHARTGREFKVRHLPMSLYFAPTDNRPRTARRGR